MGEAKTSVNPLFLREEDLREAVDMLFFMRRDMNDRAIEILEKQGLGLPHHRVLHFVGQKPGMTVGDLLDILRVTKQSLSRILSKLIQEGFVVQKKGTSDQRQRLLHLTDKGRALEMDLATAMLARVAASYKDAGAVSVQGFRRVLLGMMNPETRARFSGSER